MTVGILGLGLIGGSLARAYKLAGHTVYVKNRDESMFSFAMLSGAVDGKLNEETIPECDLLLLWPSIPTAVPAGWRKTHPSFPKMPWSSTAAASRSRYAPGASRWQSSTALPL